MKRVLLFILLLLFILPTAAGGAEPGLKDALKKYLIANSPWPDAAIIVENVEVLGEGFSNISGKTIIITSRNRARATGRVSFNVTLKKGDRTVTTAVARADVRVVKNVVVAIRPIRMREKIASDDVRLQSMDVSSIPVTAAYSLDNVVGRTAKRPLSAGRVVRGDYLERTRMVKRGQLLDVRLRSGIILVRAKATAISDGFLGGTVRARTTGGRQIQGLVSGPGQMVVNLR